MGQIVTIGSGEGAYQYELPPIPNESEILYFDLPKNQQYWRTPYDLKRQLDIKDVKRMPESEKIDYITMWRKRWMDGLFFMNHGEVTYISGGHTDHLCFNQFSGGFLRYLDAQRERFYFRDLTNKDNHCDGRCWIKPRRAGLTTEEITEAIRALISGENQNIFYQSNTISKAKSTLMKPTIDAYVKRVSWMREKFYAPASKKPVNSLELKSNVIEQSDDDYYLGGKIVALPTVSSAADGEEMVLSVIDEFSKHEGADPMEMLEVNMKAVHPFKQLKIDALSTTGDTKDAVKATMAWHKLIGNSNPQKRNPNGKTNSGLYKFFISAIHSMLIVKELPEVLDVYGKVNKEMAEEWIWNEHKKHTEGTKEYIFSMYKLPLKEEDALLSSTTSTYFRRLVISARIKELTDMLPSDLPFVRGRLDEDAKGKVWFEADPKGDWLWKALPYHSAERNIDTRNRYRMINNVHFPPVNPEGAIGYDPINYPKELTTSSNTSDASIFVRKKFDYYNKPGDPDYYIGIMGIYLKRPDNPHDANKEAIKACKFTGYPCMHERSVSHVYEDFDAANMLPFLLKDEKEVHGISPSDMKAKRDGLSMLQVRYSAPKTPEDKDELIDYPFEDGLRQLDNFDITNTGAFDVTMSEIYVEHGLKQIIFTNVNQEQLNAVKRIINEIIPPIRRTA